MTPTTPAPTTTHTLTTETAEVTYDVHGPLPTADGRPPLLLTGHPMDASGFLTLAGLLPERTVVTYDPPGMGRSRRHDGTLNSDPKVQSQALHALIDELDAGPVEILASSGGAVVALDLVASHPDDVTTLVAHEPPMVHVLPDAPEAARAFGAVREAYATNGWSAGMAAFIAMTSWVGEFTEEYFAQPAPEPASFGLPTEDDGSRDDPLLSETSSPISDYRPDAKALTAAPTRVVVATGEESKGTFTDRTARATAALLGQEVTVFPSHHTGFTGPESGYAGQPEAFAERLTEILAQT